MEKGDKNIDSYDNITTSRQSVGGHQLTAGTNRNISPNLAPHWGNYVILMFYHLIAGCSSIVFMVLSITDFFVI